MRIAGCALIVAGACVYGNVRSADGFKCDAAHPCPADFTCIANKCRAGAGLLFWSGWENRSELGCNENALIDRDSAMTLPTDTGFDGTPPFETLCTNSNGNPDAEVVVEAGPDGVETRMLRVRQSTGHLNGTEFRLGHSLAPQNDVYVSWWIKYSADWQWTTRETAMFMTNMVEVGVEGRDDGSPATIRIHLIASDTQFVATEPQISVGVWHFCELRVVAGARGRIDMRVDQMPVVLEATAADPHDVNTGAATDAATINTAYGDGAFLDQRMSSDAPWFSYYDDVRIGIGATFFED